MAILQIDEVRIGEFCKKWKVAEFAIFGSALRADFGPDSDVDVLRHLDIKGILPV